MEHAIAINRISSQRQDEGYSLSQQAKLNDETALRDGRTIVQHFDIVESAKASDRRNEFQRAVQFLRKNRAVKYVYIEKPDRLTRNLKDAVTAYELIYNDDITFVFTREHMALSKDSTSHDKFMFDIKAVLAKNYIDNLSEEVRKGQRGMLEAGGWPGSHPPTGYKKVNKQLVPDGATADMVRRLFELFATGTYSLSSIQHRITREGLRNHNGKPIPRSRVYLMLTNPIYFGMTRWNGITYEGSHQPLISKALFDKVQSVLKRGKEPQITPQRNAHDFCYRGVLRCGGCGYAITAEKRIKNQQNGNTHEWIYYHCSHSHPCDQRGVIREEDIEKMILEDMKRLSLGPQTSSWLKDQIRSSAKEKRDYQAQQMTMLRERYRHLQDKLARLYEDRSEGFIDTEIYKIKRKQYVGEQMEVMDLIKEHISADIAYTDMGCLLIDLADQVKSVFEVRTYEEKRLLLKTIYSNLVLKDKKLNLSLTEPFQILENLKFVHSGEPDNTIFEPLICSFGSFIRDNKTNISPITTILYQQYISQAYA